MAEQLNLFDVPEESPIGTGIDMPQPKASKSQNPCVVVYGVGPNGVTCADCVHLRYRPRPSGKKFWKCDLRALTDGPATDHRKSWPSCGRYEKREGEYHEKPHQCPGAGAQDDI